MKYNLTKSKVWQIIGVAVLCAVCVLTAVLGVVFGMNHSSEDLNVSKDMASDIDNGVLHDTTVRLLGGVATTASDGSVSQTITAVITPADAPNKAVDWSIAWADGDSRASENISDYITVTPASDGALTATVTCKKSFRGSVAYVKVVTREGKFEATSMITFDGIPSSLSVNASGLSTGSGVDGFQYMVSTNGASLAIDLTNVFGDVGESYYNNLTFTTSASGKITIQNYRSTAAGGAWNGTESQITLESIKDSIFSAKIENNRLIITPNKTVEGYYQSVQGGPSGSMMYGKFKSYVANSAGSAGVTPYFTIVVKCGDMSEYFNFRINSSVSSVSVTPGIIF